MRRVKPSVLFPKFSPCSYIPRRRNHDHSLDDVGSMASRLRSRSRSVVRFSGPDTLKFLQGLLTNDVRRFGEPVSEAERTSNVPTPNVSFATTPPVYAALLTPQGRFLYDFFLYKPSRPEERLDSTGSGPGSDRDGEFELFADVDSHALDEILQTLKRYRLRSKVDIENLAKDFSCWQRFGGNLSSKSTPGEEPEAAGIGWGSGTDCAGMSASQGNERGWQWFKDPRLDILGYRGIFPSGTEPPLVEADKETDEENYLLWRLEKGEAIPLEYNLEGLNAISFDKGCYVGQELIARTHHRGVIRKRLLPLKFLNETGKEVDLRVAPGSEVLNTDTGKKIGTIMIALACRGLGLLRLEEALRRPSSLTIQGQENVKVEAVRPDWWPLEWYQENQQNSAVA
ncbi:hypothetical protein CRG98_020085 [Punica granatum]|uniref:CAF17 C-terminal domain-containing protein n=1 Tax=Punica granatum TaxID=22663 RepID=A0A2I0JTB3_PUNGR|nr:hypothetical protein CRG98_020085 [Punica granatum]